MTIRATICLSASWNIDFSYSKVNMTLKYKK